MSPEIVVEQGKAVVVVKTELLKCKFEGCDCLFCSQVDRGLHLPVCPKNPVNRSRNMWHKSKNGPGEWAFTSDDLQLKSALRQHGKLLMAGFAVTMNVEETYFRRVPVNE